MISEKNTVSQRYDQQFERHFYRKILVILISASLVTNSFLSLFAFILFYSLLVLSKKPKTRIKFSASW